MFCKQCGSELKDGAVFCTNCGANQNAAVAAPAQNEASELDKTMGVFDAVPGVQQAQPAAEPSIPRQPVTEPSFRPAQQPFYQTPVQQPAQPVYQAPVQQPAYQTPVQQPAYQAPVQQPAYQAPVPPQNAYNPNVGGVHNGQVSFAEAISLFFKNYANFSGRASRSEYWWACLFNILISIPLSLILPVVPPLAALCYLALIIPGLSIAIRRLHDVGKSGAWLLMAFIPLAGGIILLIQYLKDSDGDNQWGPGPVSAAYGFGQFGNTPVNTPVNNGYPAQRAVTDNDIYAMAQSHEPVNVNTPEAKRMMDSALARIVPTYTGIENLAGVLMLCDPQSIKANIAATDTDTLMVIFKALGFYIGQGGDANILGVVQQNVLATLKTRF